MLESKFKAMKSPQTFILIIFISLTTATTESVPRYSKPGCIEKCGNMTIPYPFGIGPNCFLNKWYAVDCNSSKPYLSALKNLPLLGVDLNEQMVLVNVSMSSDCQAPVWNISQIVNLVGSPFLFSKMHNKFNVLGCGTAAISSRYEYELAECSTFCSQRPVGSRIGNCYGMNCCRVKVPYYLDTYSVSVTGNKSCVSAFLIAENLYGHELFSRQSFDGGVSSILTVLRWMLPYDYYSEASCSYNFSKHELPMSNNTSVHTGKCSCLSELEEGNPYLSGGCKVNEECTKCQEARGFCMYKVSYGGRTFTCDYILRHRRSKSSSRAIFLGVGISILILVLNALAFTLYKIIQRAKDKRRKRRFFERNGGLLLKQQEAGNDGLVEKTKLFTSNELEKATDYFNENRIIGRGGQGTVYKGMLSDGRIIAVKKSKVINQSQLEQFINEMVILSQVNHRNVVKLLGCCLETDVPILVSEFISNGTLYDHIHQENTHVFISWNMRLQIATQVAGALSYLHSATSISIYHRDIKSTNILLDEKYNAKISDFGTSRFISMGQTHLTTVVKGTLGYLDPEYFQSSQFTRKSDVYSFGVVLLELLTGEKPICIRRFGGSISLVSHFMISFEEGQVMSLLDAKMVREGGMDVLLKVANLATRCLNLCGKNRPTMKEVALELETIRMPHFSPVQTDFGKVKYNGGKEEEILMLSYGVSTSSSIT